MRVMNIHKCNEAARWKAEVLQMMWASAKNHAAGARARERQSILPQQDTICPGGHLSGDAALWRCHSPWRCHPLWVPPPNIRCRRHGMTSALDVTPLDNTPSHQMPSPWDDIFPICFILEVLLSQDAINSHWMPPPCDAISL